MHQAVSKIIVFVLLFIASFGVYLGRFLRWNSWDIMSNPLYLLSDITDRFANPFSHPATWGVTILLGLLLNFMYWTIRVIYRPLAANESNLIAVSH